jgi:hypothetical protein
MPGRHQQGAPPPTAEDDMLLTLAYSTNAYRRHSTEEAIDRIAGLGYAGIELMADEPHLWPAEIPERQGEACLRAPACARGFARWEVAGT